MKQTVFYSKNEKQTEKIGRRLARTLDGGQTVLLEGELGAGKTRFAKGIAFGLGVKDIVTSPTFALHNRYRGKKLFLNHFDFYRLNDGEEARAVGLDEFFGETDGVCVVEWGQNATGILPEHFVRVSIFKTNEGRRIEIERV